MLDAKAVTYMTVCEEMNFTRAAEKLNITQPAVTQQIHALEEYYGVPLFEFTGKRFRLTQYGTIIYEELKGMRNGDIYLKERISDLKNRHTVVNMGATLTVGEFMMAEHITSYLREHADADVSMKVANTQELLGMLDNGEIDFAVLEGNFRKSEYRHMLISEEEFAGICAPDSTVTRAECMLRDLTDNRLILREKGSGTRDIFEEQLEKNDMSVSDFTGITTIGNMRAVIELVRSGCGITFLYTDAVKELVRNKELRNIKVKGFPVKHEISAVWKKDMLQDKYIKEVIRDMFKQGNEG